MYGADLKSLPQLKQIMRQLKIEYGSQYFPMPDFTAVLQAAALDVEPGRAFHRPPNLAGRSRQDTLGH